MLGGHNDPLDVDVRARGRGRTRRRTCRGIFKEGRARDRVRGPRSVGCYVRRAHLVSSKAPSEPSEPHLESSRNEPRRMPSTARMSRSPSSMVRPTPEVTLHSHAVALFFEVQKPFDAHGPGDEEGKALWKDSWRPRGPSARSPEPALRRGERAGTRCASGPPQCVLRRDRQRSVPPLSGWSQSGMAERSRITAGPSGSTQNSKAPSRMAHTLPVRKPGMRLSPAR